MPAAQILVLLGSVSILHCNTSICVTLQYTLSMLQRKTGIYIHSTALNKCLTAVQVPLLHCDANITLQYNLAYIISRTGLGLRLTLIH